MVIPGCIAALLSVNPLVLMLVSPNPDAREAARFTQPLLWVEEEEEEEEEACLHIGCLFFLVNETLWFCKRWVFFF